MLSFSSTASKAAAAFELPSDELSERLRKVAELYKVPSRYIEQIGYAMNDLNEYALS